jgi:methyltransferase (TIGR00027 family)
VLRAAHQLLDGEPKVLVDEPIVRLLGPEGLARLHAHPDELQTPSARRLRAHVLLRSRFAEDRLAEAVERGVRQYVLLGAGLDTFALRQPAWASAITIVEIDQPATQTAKRARLADLGVTVPRNVVFAPVDFETTTLGQALPAAGVDVTKPVFFSWLGVTMYLTEDAVDGVLGDVASLPHGTEIVLTFATPPDPAHDEPAGEVFAQRAAEVGEPWITFFSPDALEARLRSVGFTAITFLTPEVARERYFRDRADGLEAPRRVSVVSAVV